MQYVCVFSNKKDDQEKRTRRLRAYEENIDKVKVGIAVSSSLPASAQDVARLFQESPVHRAVPEERFVVEQQTGKSEQLEGCSAEVAHVQGVRDSQEDGHVWGACRLEHHSPIPFFGICDGHGGTGARDFLEAHLSECIQDSFRQEFSDGTLPTEPLEREKRIEKVLVQVPLLVEAELKTWRTLHPESSPGGATLTMAFVIDNQVWTVNVGDSRTVVHDERGATQLTRDADPSDPAFRRTVERMGGEVRGSSRVGFRVFGAVSALAVARSIGDSEVTGVVARPKVTRYPVPPGGCRLVLACDGLWDVCSTRQAGDAVDRFSQQGAIPRGETMASLLVKTAIGRGSQDNVSAMVVTVPGHPAGPVDGAAVGER